MSLATPCQTSGAHFHIGIHLGNLQVVVETPSGTLDSLTEAQAALLETNVHNALEMVLARYFPTAEEEPSATPGALAVRSRGDYCVGCGARVKGPRRHRNPHSDDCPRKGLKS